MTLLLLLGGAGLISAGILAAIYLDAKNQPPEYHEYCSRVDDELSAQGK